MKKLFLLIVLFVFAGVTTLLAQTKVITGTVTSAVEGEGPIPGVTVQVPGTTIGTNTDLNGRYSLEVPQNATALVFSYIGMKRQEVQIDGRSVVNVTMESELLGLQEVVVSAFGIKRNAAEIGSAITQVESALITQAKPTSAATALSGKVAGLQINTVNASVNPDVRVVLRGNRSFLGNNQALLVLDGVPVNLAYLQTLNPNDIESMNVLKGANAAALYGSEAANGVIVVTTKTGSKDRTQIVYSNTTTFDKVAYFPEMQERFGSGSSADGYGNPLYEAFENQCWGPEFDGQLVRIGLWDEYGDSLTTTYSAKPREKYNFWDTGLTLQNDLSFSSGNETGTLFLSVQDVKIKGVVPGDEARRDVIRLNGTKQYKGFSAAFNFNYTLRTQETSNSNVYWNVMNTPMHIPLTDFSDWDAVLTNPDGSRKTNWADIDHFYNAYYENPYEELDTQRRIGRNDYVTAVLDLSQKLTKWLTIQGRTAIAPNTSYYENRQYFKDYSPYGHQMYSEYGRSISRADVPSSMNTGMGFGWRWTNDFIATINHKFSDFSVRAVAGMTTRSSYSRSTYLSAASLEIANFFNVKNRVGELGGSESWSQQRQMGVFGDITLGYKNYAYLHASGRNDWNSLLDKSQWSFFYPAVDASVVLTELIPSLKNDILSYAKIRGGISKVGSINIGNYQLENLFGIASDFPFGSLSAYSVDNGLNYRFLKPEFTLSKEIGLDLSFLNNRLNTTFTVYQTNTTNQTVDMNISRATGYESSKINSGEMLNRGFEFELKATPVSTADLQWDISANYAYWYSEVLSLAGELTEISLGGAVYAIVGYPYPYNKVTRFYQDPQGRVIVDGETGMPSIDPLTYPRGQTTPKHLIGLQTSLRWKGFTFAGSADYRGGAIFRTDLYYDLLFTGIGALSASNGRERFVFPNSVINTGTAENPVYVPNTNITVQEGGVAFWTNTMRSLSYYSVNSADVWKIRELSLTYDVPSTALSFAKNYIEGVRIGFVGRNLFMFLPKNNIYTDPEFNSGTGNAVGYSTSSQTPATRSYGFNVTLTF
ncbi:MAG TPA: SusC/RagA family TonB-linked outer membrane protein [Bacteroidales bacterium]|nr:SusC/RagA family TonB-linked outer membrane protein [Bacteroidales bacterium]HRW85569.1 SusC/RagA family TonB-linked outer membrane protein [Bacteroidales bacterium]